MMTITFRKRYRIRYDNFNQGAVNKQKMHVKDINTGPGPTKLTNHSSTNRIRWRKNHIR